MKKGTPKYYIFTYSMIFIFMTILMVINHAKGTYLVAGDKTFTVSGAWANEFHIFLYSGKTFKLGFYLLDIVGLILIPALFTGILLLIDLATGKIGSKKKQQARQDEENYGKFVDKISTELSKTHLFDVEDFRHFRDNQKFQECLKKLFLIYKDGETEENSYFLILRKFEKGSKERNAVEYLITFTEKERLQNSSKNEEEKK